MITAGIKNVSTMATLECITDIKKCTMTNARTASANIPVKESTMITATTINVNILAIQANKECNILTTNIVRTSALILCPANMKFVTKGKEACPRLKHKTMKKKFISYD